jgi:hypothetical protein
MDCAAAACCYCAACMPACVTTAAAPGNVMPEYLKISPVSGPAGVDAEIAIQGFPPYIGALYYTARVGSSGELMQMGGGTCSFSVVAPGQPPGMVPVWASHYGGGPPWVLAGFYTWDAGSAANCVQPGFSCGQGPDCCATADVPMACIGGRCRHAP